MLSKSIIAGFAALPVVCVEEEDVQDLDGGGLEAQELVAGMICCQAELSIAASVGSLMVFVSIRPDMCVLCAVPRS